MADDTDDWTDSVLDTAGSPTVWKAVSVVAGIGAAQLGRRGLSSAWRAVRHEDPPLNPLSKQTAWPEALAFAAVSGTVYGVVRMVAQRVAAGVWTSRLGGPPPGVEKST